jgi:hypothetical protein
MIVVDDTDESWVICCRHRAAIRTLPTVDE